MFKRQRGIERLGVQFKLTSIASLFIRSYVLNLSFFFEKGL